MGARGCSLHVQVVLHREFGGEVAVWFADQYASLSTTAGQRGGEMRRGGRVVAGRAKGRAGERGGRGGWGGGNVGGLTELSRVGRMKKGCEGRGSEEWVEGAGKGVRGRGWGEKYGLGVTAGVGQRWGRMGRELTKLKQNVRSIRRGWGG